MMTVAKPKYDKMNQRSIVRYLRMKFGSVGPSTGAEIGVWRGQMSAVLLDAFPDLRLTVVDPWRAGIAPTRAIDGDDWLKFEQDKWDVIYQEALTNIGPANRRCQVMRMTSEQAAAQVPDESFDFVFIDADHIYEAVRDDIALWMPKTKRILCGHDYGGKNDRFGAWGVKRAVDEAFGNRVDVRAGLIWTVDISE